MKSLSSCVSIGLILIGIVAADIVPYPGSIAVRPVFEQSDLVCLGEVEQLNIISAKPALGGTTQEREVQSTILLRGTFKGQSVSDRIFVLLRKPLGGQSEAVPVLEEHEKVLLFLSRVSPQTYRITNRFIGITPFSFIPPLLSGEGLSKVEIVLREMLHGTESDKRNALMLLQGFEALDPITRSSISDIVFSPDAEIGLSALAVLAKSRTPESVHEIRLFLDGYSGPELLPLGSISTYLGQVQDNRALADLAALSGSRFASIRFGAMTAIRAIHSLSSAETVVKRLDDPDSTVKYLAVITLSELFDGDENHAPSMYLFDKDPGKYVMKWKKWWAEYRGRGSA